MVDKGTIRKKLYTNNRGAENRVKSCVRKPNSTRRYFIFPINICIHLNHKFFRSIPLCVHKIKSPKVHSEAISTSLSGVRDL